MMKVVTFNLRCANDANGNSIDERAPRLKAVMEKYDADLVGFQEVTPRWVEHLTEFYSDEYEIFHQYRAKASSEGTPMMWKKEKFECLDKGSFWLSDTPSIESKGWDRIGCYRICLWALLKDKETGFIFTFFNTHYGFGDPCQIASGKLILDHMKALKADAAILTADFNMRPDSAGYRKLTEQLVDCNAATGNDLRCTYHGYKPEGRTDGPIDFCFITPETITPITSKRMDDTVDGRFPSDHFGVYSEIEIHEKLKLITFNVQRDGAPQPPEERARMLRSALKKREPDVFGLQETSAVFVEKLERLGRYDHTAREDLPIFWRKERLGLIKEECFSLSGAGSAAALAVLQYRGGNRKICIVNTKLEGGNEADAKLIAERIAPYGDIPVFCIGDFDLPIGSAGYKAMRETFKDARREVAPKDFTPTYNGLGEDMVPPTISDYVFSNGVMAKPISYQVIDVQPKGQYISDHNGICTIFALD